MTNQLYSGVVRDGVVVLRKASTPLQDGTEVLVTPVGGAPGSPAAVLAAVERSPLVPSEWVDELEQLMAEGRRQPTRANPFSDEPSRRDGH